VILYHRRSCLSIPFFKKFHKIIHPQK